jgi:tight adherence protein C
MLISGGGAALLALFSWWFVPDALPARPPHGVRASRRRAALSTSALFCFLEPAIRLFALHARALPFAAYRRRVAGLIVQAGEPLGLDGDEFIGVCALGGTAGAILGLIVAPDLGPAVVPVLAFVGAYYPNVWLSERAGRRLARIHKSLPYANDLLVLALQAGADFVGALRHVVGRSPDPTDPLMQELSRVLGDLDLGVTRRAALEGLAERAPTDPVRGFASAIIQAEQRGTPVAAALQIQSSALRAHRSLIVETLANRASVLILFPLMLIFVATVLILFGGVIVRALRGELL